MCISPLLLLTSSPLTRRCLFIIEKALGPRCDLTSGNVRFLYSEENNRYRLIFLDSIPHIQSHLQNAPSLHPHVLEKVVFRYGIQHGSHVILLLPTVRSHRYTSPHPLPSSFGKEVLGSGSHCRGRISHWTFTAVVPAELGI